MAAILAQNPLVAFRLLCGKVSQDFPLNMAKIGIASANRDQSPIRSSCSHWRNSPLKPMLSATWKLAITHRSICLPDFPAVSQARRYALLDLSHDTQITGKYIRKRGEKHSDGAGLFRSYR
jgi:hypothetical protein